MHGSYSYDGPGHGPGFSGTFTGGLTGLDHGGHPGVEVGGRCGPHFGPAFSHAGMDAIDFITSSEGESSDSGEPDTLKIGSHEAPISPDLVDGFGARPCRHGEVDLLRLFLQTAHAVTDSWRRGLVKIPFSRAGKPVIADTGWVDGILPVTAWAGVKDGPLPEGIGLKGGKTRMCRYYFQIGSKDWFWSDPKFDPDVLNHWEVGLMEWYSEEFGDYKSLIVIRVPHSTTLDSASRQWKGNPEALDVAREDAKETVVRLDRLVQLYEPDEESVARRQAADKASSCEASAGTVNAEHAETAENAGPCAGADLEAALLGSRPRPAATAKRAGVATIILPAPKD